jgi:hypothetical protein
VSRSKFKNLCHRTKLPQLLLQNRDLEESKFFGIWFWSPNQTLKIPSCSSTSESYKFNYGYQNFNNHTQLLRPQEKLSFFGIWKKKSFWCLMILCDPPICQEHREFVVSFVIYGCMGKKTMLVYKRRFGLCQKPSLSFFLFFFFPFDLIIFP